MTFYFCIFGKKSQTIPPSKIAPPSASIQLIIEPKTNNSNIRVITGEKEPMITDLETERYLNE